MELPFRDKGDELLPPGAMLDLRRRMAKHAGRHDLRSVAAYAFDHIPAERVREAAVVKAHITDTAVDVARTAVELHGGIGFTWECDVQFWVKRAMFDRTWLGTPRAHRGRIAGLSGW